MSGFQTYNTRGQLTIDSETKGITIGRLLNQGSLLDTGYYVFNSPLGNGSTLGYLRNNVFPNNQGLRWFQFTRNSYAFPGSSMFEANSVRFMTSTAGVAVPSGYLDVFSPSGELVWSAVGASSVPRIRDFFTIPAGHNLVNTLTFETSFPDPWICMNQFPGNVSDDGTSVGYSGIFIRRNSSTSFSLQYPSRYQNNYMTAMAGRAYSIALAQFIGY